MAPESTNVKVAMRLRPMNERERSMEAVQCIRIKDKTTTITAEDKDDKTFTYDYSYDMDSTQVQVYQDLGKPMLNKAFEGYNGTIFAYGQTGSGKSYSVHGESGTPGIVPQLNEALFSFIKSNDSVKYLVTASYLEIYQEVVHDLINPTERTLQIREHPTKGIFVDGLAELVVRNHGEIMRLMEQGNKVRQVAATNMNAHSSRSHSIFIIRIQQKRLDDGAQKETILSAKLNLVDLAGSERVTSKDGASEGAAINKSLSALGNVINALSDSQQHIPYRDSKLTRLLQESLGGNAQTVMIATVSPASVNYEETLSTLQCASRAKNIVNAASKNEDQNIKLIRELRAEIEHLRSLLASAMDGKGEFDPDKMQKMESMIEDLEYAKQESWEEKERISTAMEEERKKNLEAKGIMEYVMANLRRENDELGLRVEKLADEKARLMDEYKSRKAEAEKLKEKLQGEMVGFQRRTEELKAKGMQMTKDEQRQFSDRLETHRQDLQRENQRLKDAKKSLREVTDSQRRQKEEIQASSTVQGEDNDLRRAIAEDERKRLARENEKYLAREQSRMQRELDDQRKALEAKYGSGGDAAALLKSEVELAEIRTSRNMLQTQLDAVKEQLKAAEDAFEEAKLQHELELERQQLEHFQVFRRYRMWLEEERRREEQHQAQLLEAAVSDAIHVSSRNAELEQELRELRAMVKGQSVVRGVKLS